MVNNKELLEFTFQNSPEAIYWVNKDAVVVNANGAASKMLGYKQQDLIGRKIPDLNPDFSIRSFKSHFKELIEEGRIEFESVQMKANGEEIPVYISSFITSLHNEHVSCTYITPLTEGNKVHPISQSEDFRRKFLDIFNHSREPIFVGDLEKNKIVDVNEQACRLLGYQKEELLAISLSEIIPNQKKVIIEFFNQVKQKKNAVTDKLVFRSRSGSPVHADVSASIFNIDGQDGLLGIMHPVSEEDLFEKVIGKVTEAAIINPDKNLIDSFVSETARVLNVRYGGVSRIINEEEVELVTFWVNGRFKTPYTYNIKGSPCQLVVAGDFKSFKDKVQKQFPKSELFKIIKPESYMAVPISDSQKQPLGHFFIADDAPLERRNWVENLLRLGALRMRLEFERTMAQKALKNMNLTLERKVKERTKELSRSNSELERALNEVEKLKDSLYAENIYLKEEVKLTNQYDDIISKDRAFKKVLRDIENVAVTNSTVLFLGETGTGKEVLTRTLHRLSKRQNKPLVKINCAALPATLIESELFGHEKGAFTGAGMTKKGRFELADGGTLFLDEVGEIPIELQPKLLRALQEGEFERLGGVGTIKVDVRVVAATNRNLEEAIKKNEFRSDLYYRLNVFPIQIPPLRERKGDIEPLIQHFIAKYNLKLGKDVRKIPSNVLKQLKEYPWPGNVRELENIIERAVIITEGDSLKMGDWLKGEFENMEFVQESLTAVQRKHIINTLNQTGWKVSGKNGAAEILDLKPTTLEAKMKKLGITRK